LPARPQPQTARTRRVLPKTPSPQMLSKQARLGVLAGEKDRPAPAKAGDEGVLSERINRIWHEIERRSPFAQPEFAAVLFAGEVTAE
jgi:hypothetical protein